MPEKLEDDRKEDDKRKSDDVRKAEDKKKGDEIKDEVRVEHPKDVDEDTESEKSKCKEPQKESSQEVGEILKKDNEQVCCSHYVWFLVCDDEQMNASLSQCRDCVSV